MGNCVSSSGPPVVTTDRVAKLQPWAALKPYTRADLNRMREEFWAQPPNPGTSLEFWNALRAACEVLISATEPEPLAAQKIIDYAGIRRRFADLRICYDKRGVEYLVPDYAQSTPKNLIEN